ncbi:MAG: FAD-binding oxidoreductase [Gammaproteobacteria bacterium]|nr:FAD-binding oxidoreductase [Gammaproteobacteria bacterium]
MKTISRRNILIASMAGLASGSAWLSACSRTDTGGVATAPRSTPRARIDGFRGRIIEKGDAAYESWRQGMVWQMRKPDRFPEMILRPVDTGDVAAAVRFACGAGMKVSMRSGGHNIWGASLRDEGMLIDLANFKQVDVQPDAGTARIGPSMWARDIMAALEKHDQAFPVAHCATVPLGGYALGGGLGLNGDEWGGMACNNILGGTVVTAEGEVLRVGEKSHPDLLWAMRGGGGALPGVVTELHLKTYRRPANVFSATYVFPLALLDIALDLLDEIVALSPANTELLALMLHNPQAPPDAPPDMRKAIAVRAQIYADSLDGAHSTLDAIAAIPAADQSVVSMPAVAESFEKLFSDSMDWRRGFGFGRFAVENAWTNDRAEAVRGIAAEFMKAPAGHSHVVVQPKLAPAIDGNGAFSAAGNTYIGIYGVWNDGDTDDANVAWLNRMCSSLDKHAVGHYINEINAANDPDRVKACYSTENWKRLRDIRNHWDPENLFHDFPGVS